MEASNSQIPRIAMITNPRECLGINTPWAIPIDFHNPSLASNSFQFYHGNCRYEYQNRITCTRI